MTALVTVNLRSHAPERLREELLCMARLAHDNGAIRQEVCEIRSEPGCFTVTSLWPDEQTYQTFHASSAHREQALRIRSLAEATDMTIGTVIHASNSLLDRA